MTWSTRDISFASRLLQLINYVLISIHSYWAQVFVLPRKVLHEIERVCRAFLWSEEYYSNKVGYVKWSKVCTSLKAGGLGVRNVHL